MELVSASSPGRSSLVWRLGLLFVTLVCVVTLPDRWISAFDTNTRDRQQDFGIFYRTAHCLIEHTCDGYAIDERAAPNLAAPHAHVLIVPLMWLSQQHAYYAWLMLSAAVLAIVAFRVCQELRVRPGTLVGTALVAVFASSGMAMSLITSGQLYAVLALPVTEAWIAWRRERLSRASLWLAAAASVKLLLLFPLIWMLFRGHVRAAAILAATFTAILLAGVWWFGADAYMSWQRMLEGAPMSAHFRDGAIMQSLLRTLTTTPDFAPVVLAPELVRPLWAGLSGLLVAATIIRQAPPDGAYTSILAAALLIAPIGWVYSAWWFAGPAAAMWLTGGRTSRMVLVIIGVALWLPDTTPLWGQPMAVLTPFVGALVSWVWFGFWLVGIAAARPSTVVRPRDAA